MCEEDMLDDKDQRVSGRWRWEGRCAGASARRARRIEVAMGGGRRRDGEDEVALLDVSHTEAESW